MKWEYKIKTVFGTVMVYRELEFDGYYASPVVKFTAEFTSSAGVVQQSFFMIPENYMLEARSSKDAERDAVRRVVRNLFLDEIGRVC